MLILWRLFVKRLEVIINLKSTFLLLDIYRIFYLYEAKSITEAFNWKCIEYKKKLFQLWGKKVRAYKKKIKILTTAGLETKK